MTKQINIDHRVGVNYRPSDYQPSMLPLSYMGLTQFDLKLRVFESPRFRLWACVPTFPSGDFTNFWFFFMFVLISQFHAELFPRTQKYTNQCQNGFTWKFLIFYLHCWENLQKSASVSYQIQDFLTKNFRSTVKDRNFIHEVCKWDDFFENYWCNIF